MPNENFDNIPLLDDLISRGEITEQIQQTKLDIKAELEQKIHTILQRHTSQATAEILAIINSKNEQID